MKQINLKPEELEMVQYVIAHYGDYWVLDFTDDEDLGRREAIYDSVVQAIGSVL